MKPPAFEYYAPTTLDEALNMLHDMVSEQNRDVKLLAGGQSLIPLLNMRLAHPEVIIDLNPLEPELSYVRRDGDVLRIGALTRHYMLKSNPDILRYCPVIADAMNLVGHAAILTRGTVGGSIVHADPAAELPLVFATLGGSVTIRSATGFREINAPEFFLTYLTTNIQPDEILTEVAFPVIPSQSGQAIEEFSMRHGDFALVAAASQVTLTDDGALQDLRLGIGGIGETPINCGHILSPLRGKVPPDREALRAILHNVAGGIDPQSDIHASAEYRKELAETLSYRALHRAIHNARHTMARV